MRASPQTALGGAPVRSGWQVCWPGRRRKWDVYTRRAQGSQAPAIGGTTNPNGYDRRNTMPIANTIGGRHRPYTCNTYKERDSFTPHRAWLVREDYYRRPWRQPFAPGAWPMARKSSPNVGYEQNRLNHGVRPPSAPFPFTKSVYTGLRSSQRINEAAWKRIRRGVKSCTKGNSKSETRNPKQIRISNKKPPNRAFGASFFVLRICFGFTP